MQLVGTRQTDRFWLPSFALACLAAYEMRLAEAQTTEESAQLRLRWVGVGRRMPCAGQMKEATPRTNELPAWMPNERLLSKCR